MGVTTSELKVTMPLLLSAGNYATIKQCDVIVSILKIGFEVQNLFKFHHSWNSHLGPANPPTLISLGPTYSGQQSFRLYKNSGPFGLQKKDQINGF